MKHKKRSKKYQKRLNKRWELLGYTSRYRWTVRIYAYKSTKAKIIDECLDGIFLNLKGKSRNKSLRVQNRIFRRIVEKRMAQANHNKNGRASDRRDSHLSIRFTSKCLKDVKRIQNPKF